MLKSCELNYPTKNCCGLDVFVIPPEKKYEVLASAYLFSPVPRPNDVLEDIHTGREFLFKDLLVVKNNDRVELETPFFWDGGGSVIDWVPASSPRQKELREAKEVAFQAGKSDAIERQDKGLRKPLWRPSRNETFNRAVEREYEKGYNWGRATRLNDLKKTGKSDVPVDVDDVLAALVAGQYKVSVFSEYLFIHQTNDCHLTFIRADQLNPQEDEFSVDVCGQHYTSTVRTNHWTSATANTVPIDSRIAEALCDIKEYKNVCLCSYLELNYTRETIEKQVAAHGNEFYFDFNASSGCNIVARPAKEDDIFSSWDELKARSYARITLDQAVDFLYANRIFFNCATNPGNDSVPFNLPEPVLVSEVRVTSEPTPEDTPF